MKLHKNEEDFRNLCIITADYIGIPEEAIKRDYYIVSMLQKLQKSDFAVILGQLRDFQKI